MKDPNRRQADSAPSPELEAQLADSVDGPPDAFTAGDLGDVE